METFRMTGDNNRLYFKNYENRPDDEEFAEVMKILKMELFCMWKIVRR